MTNTKQKSNIDRYLGYGAILVVAVALGLALYTGRLPKGLPHQQLQNSVVPKSAQSVPANMLTYREGAVTPLNLREPRGLAVGPKGRIYVAGDTAIQILDAAGALQKVIPIKGSPRCVAEAKDGTVYIGVDDHVEVFTATGKFALWPPPAKGAIITSMALSGKSLWVADAGTPMIWHCDLTGKVLGGIGKGDRKRGFPRLRVPSPYLDVAAAPDGTLWITNPGEHRLEAYTANGIFKGMWGKASFDLDGFSGCCNPTNIAFLPDGRIATCEKGLPRVKIYTKTGKLDGVVAGPETFPHENAGLDVAVDGKGRILLLDPGRRLLRYYTRKEEK